MVRRWRAALVLAATHLVAEPASAYYNLGAFMRDTTCATAGIVTFPLAGGDEIRAAAIQSDGKLVVAGFIGTSLAMGRYTTAGALEWFTTMAVGTGSAQAFGVAVQADGKIVAVGLAISGGVQVFAVVRLNADGSVDNGFGTNGITLTAMTANGGYASGVAIQTDGKIVVVGKSYDGSRYRIGIARYTTAGALDTTFSGDGKDLPTIGDDDEAKAVAIQTDGKIVVAGNTYRSASGTHNDYAVLRYTTAGALDTTFNGTGVVYVDGGNANEWSTSVKIQSDGKIVFAGSWAAGGIIGRLTTAGALDNTFGTSGKVTHPLSTLDGLALQSDGKIVGVGGYTNAGNAEFGVVRYTTAGALDTTFDGDGLAFFPIGVAADRAFGVAIQADGKILAAGRGSFGGANDWAVVRMTASGAGDPEYGTSCD